MEIGAQIKKFRADSGLSQDELSEKIYVSRQTVSNWETGKSYPDINSLVLMSETFGISVDTLLKGDAEVMRELIKKEDQTDFNRLSRLYGVLLVLVVLTPVPLARFLRFYGVAIWGVLVAVALGVAFLVEKKKKVLDIGTYREIVSFLDGKRLDEIEKVREEAKRPYQKIIIVAAFALIAITVEVLMLFFLR